ncbi:coenzyme F420-dependent glucose-6-phosphate dehydrogenase [Actinoalloteichus hoggarensis]|uniref:F420-dependent glucose-6-phosphate dehydrogenase n=1 Tax=Actinoalloteichus hoggarensis TaxID=1470176 RepID=A0A221W1J6_9PSEU|nr:glucose-6-phosphate dehydrogenase (coenzyme-F420) [Actinoalloteichus hoggarensis]ASO19451.1 F420-dependent glucose-6-phosphate dehydrogenase [Actinoalloteichus hoggarensis]MBB5919844.1 coenzyme F420-dependent glucose-6-phosphate dehydrogenase [Actinoalloteichus hoggarensis]
MLKIGYKASAEQFEPRTLLKFGVLAEEAGFDSVMISDHFQPWKHTDGHAPYAFAWLGALGERTTRVQIGTSVLTPTFRHHPSMVAQATATLGVLFPGRVILGVGTGESLNEVPATGMEWPAYKERFERLGESVGLIRELWQRDHVSHEGTYYRTENATVYDRPDEQIPIFIAAGGPRMARFAGRSGDGMICTSGKGVELYRDALLPGLVEGAAKAGRDPEKLERMIEVKVSFDLDRARAMEDTRNWAALALPPESKVGVEDPREMERLAAELTAEQAASRWIVSDDAEEHVERIKTYLDLGFDHLVFHAPGEDQPRFLQLYAEQVLPRLRELSPARLG